MYALRVKVAHGSQFAVGTLHGLAAEEVARLVAEFAAHHVLIDAVVAEDAYMTQMGLRALRDAHLQVDGVAHHIDLHGVDGGEHITVIVIDVGHGIVVRMQAVVYHLLVIHVALLHVEDAL